MAAGDKRPTRGGDLLAKCPDSHAEIASKMGVDKSLVTRWISGARKPTPAQILRLEELYGIPAAAWQEPSASRPESSPASLPSPPVLPPPAPRSPPPRPADEDEDEGNNDRLQRYIRDGMRELELDTELSGVKRAEALKKLVDAQVSLDKSTGENALTMTKIAAHPEFKRVVRLITDAVAPHPEVLAKVLDALRANP